MIRAGKRSPVRPITILRSSAASVLVLPLIVAGLLSSPTSCLCGADVPHSHSLFTLRGHHHGRGHDSSHHRHAGEHETTDTNINQQGPQLRAPVTSSLGSNVAAFVGFMAAASHTNVIDRKQAWPSARLNDGQVITPESPPPWS